MFENIEELYIKIEPVLKIKSKEIGARERDIFEYLKESKWKNAKDLRFYEMVNDIIELDGDDLIEEK